MYEALLSPEALAALAQVILIDLVLAGDNAIVVGLAASSVAPEMRRKVIFWGIAAAVILRIIFAVATTQLLQIKGLMLGGGILLLWVCWRFAMDLIQHKPHESSVHAPTSDGSGATGPDKRPRTLGAAIWTIIIADVSMSLDNVLAVAGAAMDHVPVLIFGLVLSVALMGVAATLIARLLERFRWIGWLGLAVIVYVAGSMIWKGAEELQVMSYFQAA